MKLDAIRIFSFTGHKGPVYALEQGPSAHQFFSGGSDRIVVEWNMMTKEEGNLVAQMPGIIYCLKYLPSKNLLFAGLSTGGIHVIDLETKKEIKNLAYHQGPVFELVVVEVNQLLISAGGDGLVHFISIGNFNIIKTISLGNQKIRSLAIHPDHSKIFVGCQDGTVSVIGIPTMEPLFHWQAHTIGFSVNTLLFTSGGNFLLSGSRDAHIQVYEVTDDCSRINSIPAHHYAIYHLVNSPDLRFIASASRDKSIKIWNQKHEMLLRIDLAGFGGHVNSVNRLLWSAYQNRLVSTGDDRSILMWEINGIEPPA